MRIDNYIIDYEPGACMVASPHAWMTKDLFIDWFTHFQNSIPSGVSPNNRLLQIFYGHGSHVAIETIEKEREIGVDLLTFLPHTSHKLQPLDLSLFAPFKSYFKLEHATFFSKFPNIEVQMKKLAMLGNKAMKRALTIHNIKARFKRIGIWPLNLDALINNMHPSDIFEVNEDANAMEKILNLSRLPLSSDNVAQLHSTLPYGHLHTTTKTQ